MKKTKKRSAKRPRPAEKSRDEAPEKGASKASKTRTIQGVRVLTPQGKMPGRRGAEGYLKLSQIRVVKGFNPRSKVGDTADLERSIRRNGLLHPLVVRPSGDGKTFQLVTGERRYNALRNLGEPWSLSVPVNVRVDLEGDDLASKAVAIAENSEDVRSDLTYIEIGRVCAEMVKKKWSIGTIAAQTGLDSKKVRRALELIEAPDAIVKRVEKGDLVPMAALELTKLLPEQQTAVLEKVGPGATIADVRRIRKQMEREERRDAIARGEDRTKTATGKPRERMVVAWKSALEKRDAMRKMCYGLLNYAAEERDTADWYELRGSIAYALWDRGDLEAPLLPPADVKNADDPAAAKKANLLIDGILKNEAALYKPEKTEKSGKKRKKKSKSKD